MGSQTALANQLEDRNKQLETALKATTQATKEMVEAQRLQSELAKALESERQVRLYAEGIKTELQEFVNNATEGLH